MNAVVVCPTRLPNHDHFITAVGQNGDPDNEMRYCSRCQLVNQVLTRNSPDISIEDIICMAEMDLEGNNRSDMVSLPRSLYRDIQRLVPQEHKIELARILEKAFSSNA
jgi:hypothetical protein